MAELKQGIVASWQRLSDILAIFSLEPEPRSCFPDYAAGQYIALQRENCRLTRKHTDGEGRVHYLTDFDPLGNPKRGRVTHSYTISSAPFETARDGHLEFYVVLEADDEGNWGRLTESLFTVESKRTERVGYYDRIAGNFTVRRAAGFKNVLFVGTGTGLAPFVSMIKQLHHEASQGKTDAVRYTLIHANRTRAELAYHEELEAIEAADTFDFVYVGSVSRPTPEEILDPTLAVGRANNLIRDIFDMPLKEEEDITLNGESTVAAAHNALPETVRPMLPSNISRNKLLERLDPPHTVLMCCGNPWSMADIKRIADRVHMRFEKEDWKPTRA